MSENELSKIIFMGLAIAGKSSIYSVVFNGKTPKDVENYEATQDYFRTGQEIFKDNFQIFDLGGQESFLSIFLGDMAEFIFSNVSALIWVIDVSDSEHVSTSKYYFDMAIKTLNKYSNRAIVLCLFHKMDKIQEKFRTDVKKNMEFYFKSPLESMKINYLPTSIYDKSVFEAIGTVLIELIRKSKKKSKLINAIQNTLNGSESLLGVMLYTKNCLPVLKEGEEIERLFLTSNIFCSSLQMIQSSLGNQHKLSCNIETDEFKYVFYKYDPETFITFIVDKRTTPQQIEEQKQKISNVLKG